MLANVYSLKLWSGTLEYLSPSDRERSRRFQHPHVQLSGPVPVHGIRVVDLPGESTRKADQVLSPGFAWHGQSQRAGRCQRVARLAHPR